MKSRLHNKTSSPHYTVAANNKSVNTYRKSTHKSDSNLNTLFDNILSYKLLVEC